MIFYIKRLSVAGIVLPCYANMKFELENIEKVLVTDIVIAKTHIFE